MNRPPPRTALTSRSPQAAARRVAGRATVAGGDADGAPHAAASAAANAANDAAVHAAHAPYTAHASHAAVAAAPSVARPAATTHGAAPAADARPAPGPAATPRRALAWAFAGAAAMIGVLALAWASGALPPPGAVPLTQAHIDAAVRRSLETEPLPSPAVRAAAAVRPSVVRVVGLLDERDDGDDNASRRALDRSLGTGVVIVDDGTILTSLHVVAGALRIRVRFADGTDSDARLVNTQPDHDLAVLKATRLPDDLQAATTRSTADLAVGEQVVAVGYPFGIGASVSAGVVSGLRREFQDPDGQGALTNLIQFDAAANPGNSGGPLVTMDGHVVGIVTAILNPGEARTFIGIGFAVPIENAAAAAGLSPF